MRILKYAFPLILGIIGTSAATPAFAGCISGPYVNPPANNSYTGSVSAGGMTLFVNNNMYSPSGNYRLTFQTDGNLVLYSSSGAARWATNVRNCLPTPNASYEAFFQADGNLVVYYIRQNDGTQLIPVWDSHTYGHPNATLSVQDDGNLVIRDGSRVLFSVF